MNWLLYHDDFYEKKLLVMMLENWLKLLMIKLIYYASIHTSEISSFIIYLLEDEQELSLGMLIRLQRIDNLSSIHANILQISYTFGKILNLAKPG